MTYPTKYFLDVFAASGDVTPVPNTVQVDGSVSYAQGYGPDYQLDPATNPSALDIDRSQWNALLKDITGAVQYWQQHTVAYWIDNTTAGGSAFSYDKGAIVLYTDGLVYQSLVATNTAVPGSDVSKWQVLGAIEHQVILGATTTGTAAAQLCACTPTVTALVTGMLIDLPFGFDCTGAGTLKLDGTTAKAIKKWLNGALVDPAAGDFKSAQQGQAFYDGTQFILNMPLPIKMAYDTAPQLGGVLDSNAHAINESKGASVASATATNIWGTDGNTLHITGTTTITSFGTAPRAGAWRKVIFDGVLTLTNGANLALPGAANITTAAGDMAYVFADTTTAFLVNYFPVSGKAVVSSTSKFVNRAYAEYLTYSSLSNGFPQDDTIPQNTEGTQILTITYTPASATNILRIIANVGLSMNAGATTQVQTGLFQDSTANALTAVLGPSEGSSGANSHPQLIYEMVAGTTSATTFKVRVGTNSGTIYINGDATNRRFGGVAKTCIFIEEFTP